MQRWEREPLELKPLAWNLCVYPTVCPMDRNRLGALCPILCLYGIQLPLCLYWSLNILLWVSGQFLLPAAGLKSPLQFPLSFLFHKDGQLTHLDLSSYHLSHPQIVGESSPLQGISPALRVLLPLVALPTQLYPSPPFFLTASRVPSLLASFLQSVKGPYLLKTSPMPINHTPLGSCSPFFFTTNDSGFFSPTSLDLCLQQCRSIHRSPDPWSPFMPLHPDKLFPCPKTPQLHPLPICLQTATHSPHLKICTWSHLEHFLNLWPSPGISLKEILLLAFHSRRSLPPVKELSGDTVPDCLHVCPSLDCEL